MFKFLKTWMPPITGFRLASGPLAVVNVLFIIVDDSLDVEEILSGLLAL